jgi:prepilin-type N-terminal cleavage/methylation domain-containing protein
MKGTPVRTRLNRFRSDESGFTLIELLVASLLLGVVAAVGTSMLVSAQRSADVSTAAHQSVEEARLGLNRVTRELRQATAVTFAQNPDGSARDDDAVTLVSFTADFNGDGCIDGVAPDGSTSGCLPVNASDPEALTYCHEPPTITGAEGRLFVAPVAVTSAVSSCASLGGLPILAGGVDLFGLSYRSNLYRFDGNTDGVTSWSELDAALAPVGNGNDVLDVELAEIDAIVIDLTLDHLGSEQPYRSAVALRNKA